MESSSTLNGKTFLMTKSWRIALVTIFLLTLLVPARMAGAQEPEGAIYVVQEGDSLWDIAIRFRVSLADLSQANGISDPGQLSVGSRLTIPGLEGIQGTLSTSTVGYGDNLTGLSRRYRLPIDTLVQLNHLASPAELYAGASLVLLEGDPPGSPGDRMLLSSGQSLLELAVANGINPWTMALDNDLDSLWRISAGEVLHTAGSSSNLEIETAAPSALPGEIQAISIAPSPLVQGNTTLLNIEAEQGTSFTGSLLENELHFHQAGDGNLVALQGIHAMTPPGLYSMTITGTLPAAAAGSASTFAFSQAVLISSGNYPFDPVLTVSPETIDPAVTAPEDAQWSALAAPVTDLKQWDGMFGTPAPPPYSDCWPSLFGNRRSYNGSAYSYFHSGLDFCGGVGGNILAPADGTVVFAGPMTVRGNATMIDHGWGVYTGYLHQSEIMVSVGEQVSAGQIIGLVGGTGRVTGPHLHWEVWVGGVQVDPMEWLESIFP